MLVIHVTAGLIALIAGAVALFAPKGSALHRRGGFVFAIAMLVMTASALVMAGFLRPNRGNVVAGSLTFYLVATGMLAVMRPVERVRGLLVGLALAAAGIAVYAMSLGLEASAQPRGVLDGIPAPALYMFATVAFLGAMMDAKLLHAGRIEGSARLTRHLWRMGYAMWIATLSFFLGQADEFPDALRNRVVLATPVLLVTATMLYWVARAFWMRRRPLRDFLGRRAIDALARDRVKASARTLNGAAPVPTAD
ncbi:MAG TPA: DUF2306 domain-containing protein [Xanthomonadales bacterium]|nr:DUF2306 domain-containing protein [Xanthomonadales bacterium]